MKRDEARRYIEEELPTIISMYAEVDYTLDRLGNIVFRNRKAVYENIKKEIEEASKKTGIKKDKIEYSLKYLYNRKCATKPSFLREGTELIRILKEIGIEERREKNKQRVENNSISR